MRALNHTDANKIFNKVSRIDFTFEEDEKINNEIDKIYGAENPAALARINKAIDKKIKKLNREIEKLVELRAYLYSMTTDL